MGRSLEDNYLGKEARGFAGMSAQKVRGAWEGQRT